MDRPPNGVSVSERAPHRGWPESEKFKQVILIEFAQLDSNNHLTILSMVHLNVECLNRNWCSCVR